ncbi:hypothetical protein F8388_005718 [Cannabis sativa]|uniref:Uncharacterized protein n=1 Tax=Cannabis sativa TaxID=3483 RepID=A0A7J6HQZ7_CANSA|nr:hypothetical protein F8388_005718 [Cannabis sativa]KAF4397713.1 hypothetical protein G4B88_027582 [Cannabis sativa]
MNMQNNTTAPSIHAIIQQPTGIEIAHKEANYNCDAQWRISYSSLFTGYALYTAFGQPSQQLRDPFEEHGDIKFRYLYPVEMKERSLMRVIRGKNIGEELDSVMLGNL